MRYTSGPELMTWRERLGVSRSQLARLAGLCDRGHVRKVELLEIKRPALATIQALNEALERAERKRDSGKGEVASATAQ